MGIYITQGRYTQQWIKGIIDKPEDRREAIAKLMEASGYRLIEYYVTLGEYDFLIISEGPDDLSPAALVATAAGLTTDLRTTVAYTTAQLATAAEKAGKIMNALRPPGS